MSFIEINGRILDREEYLNDVSALRFELRYELAELLFKYGFELMEKKTIGRDKMKLCFNNTALSLRMDISLRLK